MIDEPFFIDVQYKGSERHYETRLQVLGYTHRFLVQVEDRELYFERDEEGSYRAILPPETDPGKIDVPLLQAIATRIEEILK